MTDPRQIARRYAAERRFKAYGAAALAVTALFLAFLAVDIVGKGWPAFFAHHTTLTVSIDADKVDAAAPLKGDYDAIVKKAFRARFPAVTSRGQAKKLTGLLSVGAADDLRRLVAADTSLIGTRIDAPILLSADADLYFKGAGSQASAKTGAGAIRITEAGEGFALSGDVAGIAPGEIVRLNKGALRVVSVAAGVIMAEALLPPENLNEASAGSYDILTFRTPEAERRLSDQESMWLESLKDSGLVERGFNWRFFTSGDSREPELAGLLAALVGSLYTVFITLIISLPLGVAAATYLEEFAPRNRWTQLIEVNINNLAAVPSIIFGLLGLAVFLNFFELPRSAALVGGLVLALLVLPTIIIASRAAFRAVPPSIREAALGVGASHQQAVCHHVLPLAIPGILTGTILGVSRALGETAPLLMIGMVAFIVDVPGGVTEAATALPVQIFLWSDLPELGFQSKTAAAIMVLMVVLFCLNAVAIYLRKRFERRW